MGWFDEQVKQRLANDQSELNKAYQGLAAALAGPRKNFSSRPHIEGALEEICAYFNLPMVEIPENIKDLNERIEFALRPTGILRRRIKLEGNWWKEGIGPLLCETKQGEIIALIPRFAGGYRFRDRATGLLRRVTQKEISAFATEAICFYKPLPQRKLTPRDLLKHLLSSVNSLDWLAIAGATLFAALLGMLTPIVNRILFTHILPSGNGALIWSVSLLLLGAAVSLFLLDVSQSLLKSRIQTKMSVNLESAIMGRVINLPASFFKQHSAGSLSERIYYLNYLCELLCEAGLGTGLPALFSLVYLFQIGGLTPALVLPAAIILTMQLGIALVSARFQTKLIDRQMSAERKVGGLIYALYSGIQKIKLTGSEKRAFANWASLYEERARAVYNPPLLLRIQSGLSSALAVGGMALIYLRAGQTSVTPAQFMAFSAAYGLMNGAVLRLISMTNLLAFVKPIIASVGPILEAQPETNENMRSITSISGNIEVNNLSFRYDENGPLILNNVSFKIRRGQYVAIVGKTGCGKSTLLRLLLGFEKLQTGAIYYDNIDIQSVDLRSLRRNIGVVLQNGRLFTGDIFANITISAPWLSLQEAWEAARLAGIEEDIKAMPMGMHTILSEGSGGISGGQRQRLMIARAIAPKPKVLMMDEATSALDNITQKQVSDALDTIKCTRIIIAHRLSTIKQCDRIIVLDEGRIIEDGSYEELYAKNGFFAELVRRQQVDSWTGDNPPK
jgi:NHLM bacteriocin system ABC transporter ATP-binding protein